MKTSQISIKNHHFIKKSKAKVPNSTLIPLKLTHIPQLIPVSLPVVPSSNPDVDNTTEQQTTPPSTSTSVCSSEALQREVINETTDDTLDSIPSINSEEKNFQNVIR